MSSNIASRVNSLLGILTLTFTASEQLEDEFNYDEWLKNLTDKISAYPGSGVYEYMTSGETSTTDLTEEEANSLIKLLDSASLSLLYKSISESLFNVFRYCDFECDFNGHGFFKKITAVYGHITFQAILDKMESCHIGTPSKTVDDAKKKAHLLQLLLENSQHCDIVATLYLLSLPRNLAYATRQAYLEDGNPSEGMDLEIIRVYAEALAPKFNFAMDLNTESDSPTANVSRNKPTSCHNCGKSGHSLRQCSHPRRKGQGSSGKSQPSDQSTDKSSKFKSPDVYLTTAAVCHVIKDRHLFTDLNDEQSTLYDIGNNPVNVTGKGTAYLEEHGITLKDACYVPDAPANLISVTKALENGARFSFKKNKVWNCNTDKVIGYASNGLFKLGTPPKGTAC